MSLSFHKLWRIGGSQVETADFKYLVARGLKQPVQGSCWLCISLHVQLLSEQSELQTCRSTMPNFKRRDTTSLENVVATFEKTLLISVTQLSVKSLKSPVANWATTSC